ncbi:MAG TPA: hypothetical protein VEL79_00665 [Vicinamibacterales bacterium]|nr:hypothetical protein [Vicinamibacterales bacterium]
MKSLKTVRFASGWSAAAALCLVCALAVEVGAAGPPPVRASVRTTRGAGGATHATTVLGNAWNADSTPIARARLQLRDVISGRVEATTVADERGEFTFSAIEGGTYVVELVSADSKILAVGHPFAIATGETVSTFVRLGTKVPWFSGFFSNAAAAAATTAASQGITALAPVQIPTSRKQ